MIRKSILPLLLIFFPILVHADSISKSILIDNLGEMIDFVSDKEARFCPTNKCEVYKTSKSHSDFYSYIFLDLYHSKEYLTISEYIKKESTFRNNTKDHENAVMKKLKKYCKKKENDVFCILNNMQKELNISECWSNYDEGHYCEVCNGETSCVKP